jgi:ribosome-binding protein aMBF1 (putative translation factor)
MHNKLRVHRVDRAKPISQMDLAALVREQGIDMSRDRLWRIENGHYDPTDEEQEVLARVLGVARDVVFPALAATATSTPAEDEATR